VAGEAVAVAEMPVAGFRVPDRKPDLVDLEGSYG